MPRMHGWIFRLSVALLSVVGSQYRSQGKTRILPRMHGWIFQLTDN
ncbi:MAG: hypothetical protein F6K17_22915 [Okeania sp. SIO3C4]|nr:hypothetical protein [Okeania sp. SIO3C4]